jgi:hypothetical protein
MKIKKITVESLFKNYDKSLAFPISPMGGLQHNQKIFLGWVKEVRTTKT